MKSNKLYKAIFLLLLGVASCGAGAVPAADGDMAPNDKALNQLYWQGHEALKQSDWNAAFERFSRLEKQLAEKEPANADAAVYWQAYALLQGKRIEESRRTVQRLHEKFPASRWGKEADALLRQTQPARAQQPGASGDDEDLAETAVEGLMNAPPARALPLLKKILQGKQSDKVKKRALFVLSQLDDSAALDAVVEVARSGDPALRAEAIRMLGVSGDAAALAKLADIYRAADAAQRREVLRAWMIADRADLVFAAARDETDAQLRQEAIGLLGAMDATAELKQLVGTSKDVESQTRIVQALGVAGDVAALSGIAQNHASEEVRIAAVHAIGVAGDEAASAALLKLYASAGTAALREAVLHGLLVAGDDNAMAQLYRQAKTKQEKQAILRLLGNMDSDAAIDIIEQELN